MSLVPPPAASSSAQLRQRAARMAQVSVLAWALAGGTAAMADPSALPPEQESQGVTYLTGGVDLDQSTAIKAAMRQYPLVVEVYQTEAGRNAYTASSELSVTDTKGTTAFTAKLDGPFALLKLKPGRYDVKVTYAGQTKQRRVQVPASGSTRATFVFSGN